MKTIIAAIVMLTSLAALPQDHAPLPEQCRADYNLWSKTNKDDLEKIPFLTPQQRQLDLYNCAMSLPKGKEQEEFAVVYLMYQTKMEQPEISFIKRHNLAQQMLDEDAAGQR
jgi:hypothetical protein